MVELSDHVEAEEEPLLSVYSGDSTYQIPPFQRPFSWSEGNFEDLVDDIVSAFENEVPDHTRDEGHLRDESGEYPYSISEMEPYFLGSLILKKTENGPARYDVIDGQQRLTSLSILIAVLRDLMQNEWNGIVGDGWVDTLHEYIYVSGSLTGGTQEMIRLHVRDREGNFYKENVLEKGSTIDPPGKGSNNLTDPQNRMLTAIDVFKKYLKTWVDKGGDPTLLVPYLTLRVAMVKIETYSLQSAFRLFNVTNARGTPLTNADLLKSENLRVIPEDQRGKYSNTWEQIEADLDNEGLEELIGLMRHIKIKDKNRSTIHEEFKNRVFDDDSSFQGAKFIEELEQLYDIYCARILDGDLNSSDPRQDVHYHNLVSLLHNVYPSDEWMLPILSFDLEFNDHDVLYELTMELERNLAIGWYTSDSTTDRYNLVYDLLEKIEDTTNPEEVLNAASLDRPNASDAEDLWRALDATNFYRKGNYAWPKYLFLRLELARYANETVEREYGETISIEHILPQTPDDEYWSTRFNDEEFLNTWTDRLGNLVPLEARKNYKASNKPFKDKYKEYFKARSEELDLVTDLEKYEEWSPERLQSRHEELKKETIDLWFDRREDLDLEPASIDQHQESSEDAKDVMDALPARPDNDSQTVFCQMCQKWTHPRSECARSSNHDTAPLPIMKLIHSGPLVSDDIKDGQGLSPESRRQHKVNKFNPMSSSTGPSDAVAFRTVYYLEDRHSPDNIIKQWIDANEKALRKSETTKNSLTYHIPSEFTKAWDELKENYDWLATKSRRERESTEQGQQTCPECGETTKNLPRHIRACDGESE